MTYVADLEKQTVFELFSLLLHHGWIVTKKESLKGEFVCKDDEGELNEKEFTIGRTLFKEYLQCLILAESLLQDGLEKIWHEQNKSYYKCVKASSKLREQGLLPELQPNKTAAFYKQLLQRTRPRSKTQNKGDAFADEPSVSGVMERAEPRAGTGRQKRFKGQKDLLSESEHESQSQEQENMDTDEDTTQAGQRLRDNKGSKQSHGKKMLSQAVATISERSNAKKEAAEPSSRKRKISQPETASASHDHHQGKKSSAIEKIEIKSEQVSDPRPPGLAPEVVTVNDSESEDGTPVVGEASSSSVPRPAPAMARIDTSLPQAPAGAEDFVETEEDDFLRPPRLPRARRVAASYESSSMLNASTVWIDNIPVVKRSDKGIVSGPDKTHVLFFV